MPAPRVLTLAELDKLGSVTYPEVRTVNNERRLLLLAMGIDVDSLREHVAKIDIKYMVHSELPDMSGVNETGLVTP